MCEHYSLTAKSPQNSISMEDVILRGEQTFVNGTEHFCSASWLKTIERKVVDRETESTTQLSYSSAGLIGLSTTWHNGTPTAENTFAN